MPDLAANLDLLRANAPAVWLAELGAWLHNAGKLHPIFLRKQAGILNNSPFDYRHVVGLVLERWRGLSPETQISLAKSLDVKPQKFENRLAESAVFPFLRGPRIDLPAPFDDQIGRAHV